MALDKRLIGIRKRVSVVKMEVKFNKPYVSGNEITYVNDCILNRKTSGDGYYTNLVSTFLENTFKARKVLMTTSGTSALELACLMLDIGEGDEVIMPSFTFPSTANAVVLRGGQCVFVDVDDQFNIDLDDLKKNITKDTKAVIVVHYAGSSCDMDELMKLSEEYDFYVIEDAAQAVNSKYKGKYLGTIGDLGCFSFHETKNYSCGEGGALLINRDDSSLKASAEIIREKGTNRADFNRGNVDFYTWVSKGSSYLPSDILCAHLYAQLEKLEEINALRKERFEYYKHALSPLLKKNLFKIQDINDYNDINYHMFYIVLVDKLARDRLMSYLNENQIGAYFHYIPLHTSPMNLESGRKVRGLPNTEKYVDCLLRLPLYPTLSFEEMDFVVEKIKDFFLSESVQI
jgi:dTDP-4-amino-4,6-dideoxygalactose transaminase